MLNACESSQCIPRIYIVHTVFVFPDSKVHGANMGPTWVLSAPDGPHVVPMNLAVRVVVICCFHVVIDIAHTAMVTLMTQGQSYDCPYPIASVPTKQPWKKYRKVSNIRRTESQNLNDSRLVFQGVRWSQRTVSNHITPKCNFQV